MRLAAALKRLREVFSWGSCSPKGLLWSWHCHNGCWSWHVRQKCHSTNHWHDWLTVLRDLAASVPISCCDVYCSRAILSAQHPCELQHSQNSGSKLAATAWPQLC